MNPGPPIAEPSTRRLGSQHRRQVARHLLALSSEDRGRRFMTSASDGYIERYVASMDFNAGFVLGAFQHGQLRGVAHAASGCEAGQPMLEVGLSVDQRSRRFGLGRELLRDCLLQARADEVDRVVLFYQPTNHAMAATARSLGARARTDEGEMRAEFTPLAATAPASQPRRRAPTVRAGP